MALFAGKKTGGLFTGTSSSKIDLNDLDSLERLVAESARQAGVEGPKQSKVISGLKTAAGILSATNSFMAGTTRALVTGKNPVVEGPRAFWDSLRNGNVTSFSDVIKETYTPETFGQKAGVEALGFTADVVFDPLTYLTFGVGKGIQVTTKAGSRVLSRSGQGVYQRSVSKILDKVDDADNVVREIMGTVADDGLSIAKRRKFNDMGISDDIIDDITLNSRQLFDEGGIKLAGKSLVKGETIAQSKVGQATKKVVDTPLVQEKINALKTLFSFGGKVDPRISKLLEESAAQTAKATDDIFNRMLKLFDNTNEKQLDTFFKRVDNVKRSLVERVNNKVKTMSSLPDAELKSLTGLNVVRKGGKVTKATKESLEAKARKEVKKEMQSEKLVFDDPRLQKLSNDLFEGDNAFTKELAKNAGLPSDQHIKFYIPTEFEEFRKAGNFGGATLSSVKKPFQKKFTGAERDDQITDPFSLYTRKAVEIKAAQIKSETLEKIAKTVGLSEKQISEMAEGFAGKKLSKEATEKAAEKMGYAKISRETLDGKVEFFVPKDAKQAIDELYSPQKSSLDVLGELSGFDFVTRLFKGYVTAPFPGFHVRNMTSNQFQNAVGLGVDVLNPVQQKEALDMAMFIFMSKPSTRKMFSGAEGIAKQIGERTFQTKTGKTIKYKDLIEQIQNKTTFLDAGAFGDFEQMLKQGQRFIRGGNIDPQSFNPLSSDFALVSGGRAVGNVVENQSKMVHIISKIKQGYNLDEAIKSAEDVLFNYAKLTPFERNVMRRIIPFYTFMSRNMALQAKTLATKPGFIANQLKAFESAGKVGGELTDEEQEGIPDYLLSKLGINLGKNKMGQPQILAGFGLPIEEFLDRFSGEKGVMWNAVSNTITQSNPVIKYPVEVVAGVDLFYGRPIAEIKNANGMKSMFDSMPEPVANEMKSWIGYYEKEVAVYKNGKKVGTELRGYADPVKLHFMRNLPTARLQSTQSFLQDSGQTIEAKALRFFTGAKAYSIDTEREKFFQDLERKQELQRWLVDVLGYKTFESIYKPKN